MVIVVLNKEGYKSIALVHTSRDTSISDTLLLWKKKKPRLQHLLLQWVTRCLREEYICVCVLLCGWGRVLVHRQNPGAHVCLTACLVTL